MFPEIIALMVGGFPGSFSKTNFTYNSDELGRMGLVPEENGEKKKKARGALDRKKINSS